MSWFEQVEQHLSTHLESCTSHYFNPNGTIRKRSQGYAVSHCPFCGIKDAFFVQTTFVKCFACNVNVEGRVPSLVQAVRLREGDERYIRSLEAFTGIRYPGKTSGAEDSA